MPLRHAFVLIYRSNKFCKFILFHIFFVAKVKVIFSPIISFNWLAFGNMITTDSCILIFYSCDFTNSLIVCDTFLLIPMYFRIYNPIIFKSENLSPPFQILYF